jgi:hypothetical protein
MSVSPTQGRTTTFTVTAVGTPPLNYQWSFNLTNILSGATNTTYTISSAQPANAGLYSVVVANAYGSVTSAPVQLKMLEPTEGRLQCQDGSPLANCAVTVDFWANGSRVVSVLTTTDNTGYFSCYVDCSPYSGQQTDRKFVISSACCPNQTWTLPSQCCCGNIGTLVCTNCGAAPCQPLCRYFNDNSLHGWQPDPAAPNVGVAVVPGGQGGANDYHVQVSDQSGASAVMASSESNGDWSCLCTKCAQFCYDYTVLSDGCPCPGDARCTNAVNGHQNIVPSFALTGCGGKSFTFVWTQFVATEPGGSNPGWHRICAPVGPAVTGGLPTSPSGHWVPGPGTSASDWCCVLGDVQKITWSPDFSSCQSEVIGIDNVRWTFDTNCVAPRCQDFSNGTLNGWQPDPAAPNIGINVAQPGPSGPAGDYYVRVSDQSGPSLVMAGSEFNGNWSCYSCSTCCGEFSYDYRVFSDGCPCPGDPRCTNLVGGAQQVVPRFQLVGCNGKSFTFTWTYFTVTEDSGPNPGWHKITAPLGQVAAGSLPFSQYGVWTPGTGTTTADWCSVLQNVCKITFSPDFTSCQSEVIGIDNVCLSYSTNCAKSSINKDFSNNTGQPADGVEVVLAGNYPASSVVQYPGPYWSGGIPQPNTTFPNFSVTPSGTNTILGWSGQTFPAGASAHVGFEVPGAPARMLAMRWTSGGAALTCVKQVNQHTWGNDNSVVLANDLSLCQSPVLYAGNMAVEYSYNPVDLSQLNSSVTNRDPLARYQVPGVFRVPAGATTNVTVPAGPANARWAVLVYTVSSSQNLSGPGNTTDFTQVPLEPPVAPAISDPLTISVTVSGGSAVLRWSSEGTLQGGGTVTSPWTDVVGATSPYTVSTTNTQRFFRVRPAWDGWPRWPKARCGPNRPSAASSICSIGRTSASAAAGGPSFILCARSACGKLTPCCGRNWRVSAKPRTARRWSSKPAKPRRPCLRSLN